MQSAFYGVNNKKDANSIFLLNTKKIGFIKFKHKSSDGVQLPAD